jgi:hypothetical protein
MPSPSSLALSFTMLVIAVGGCGPSPSAPEQAPEDQPAEQAATQTEPATKAEAGPVIACDEAVFEFGSVAPSESVTHVFKLVNRGDTDLHIERVERT